MRLHESPIRLAIVVQHPVHYHLPLFRAMASDSNIDVDVLFMQSAPSEDKFDSEFGMIIDWGMPMFAGYPYRVFRNMSPKRNSVNFLKFINPALVWQVLTGPYDAIYVDGHNHLTHVLALFAARISGKRVIFRADAYNLGERPMIKRLLRRIFYGFLYKLVHVCLYMGRYNREYYESFGVTADRLVYAPFIVDNEFFADQEEQLKNEIGEIKTAFGIDTEDSVILFCAKFIEKKQPLRLISAFCRADLGDHWTLLMVGDGALRPAAEALAAANPRKKIIFAGFLDQTKVSRGYVVADIFVLPSAFGETWGLVVNEAFNFGCATIVSDRVGSGPDLVADNCGLIVPHDDSSALADALRRLATDKPLRVNFQTQARNHIKNWSVANYMTGLREALGLS